ncbi:MAG TPA: hypothetical protein VM238_03635 [Phycisphaerae bacterium]|nr:hypothetical protein [Phycisphaerae bacterium]
MSVITAASKFIVAAVGIVVALGFLDPGTAQNIVGAVTALAVYWVTNK